MRRRANEVRWRFLPWAAPVLVLGAIGCHHRAPTPVVLPAQTPVPLVTVPPAPEGKLAEPPKAKLPAMPVTEQQTKPKKSRRRQKAAATPGAVAATPSPSAATAQGSAGSGKPAEAPAASAAGQSAAEQKAAGTAAIGALTVGSEQSPRTQQEAAELIAANERRLNGMNAETARTQATLVSQARNFQRQAQQALKSGDAEGAKTLATKGKLLLDDADGPKTTP